MDISKKGKERRLCETVGSQLSSAKLSIRFSISFAPAFQAFFHFLNLTKPAVELAQEIPSYTKIVLHTL